MNSRLSRLATLPLSFDGADDQGTKQGYLRLILNCKISLT